MFFASRTCFHFGAAFWQERPICGPRRSQRAESRRWNRGSDNKRQPQKRNNLTFEPCSPLGGTGGGNNSLLSQLSLVATDNASLPCNNWRACIGEWAGGGARRATAPPCIAGGNIIDRRLAASMRGVRRATADAQKPKNYLPLLQACL